MCIVTPPLKERPGLSRSVGRLLRSLWSRFRPLLSRLRVIWQGETCGVFTSSETEASSFVISDSDLILLAILNQDRTAKLLADLAKHSDVWE